MKPSQILLVFIGVFVFLTVGLLAVTHAPGQLLAQPPEPTSISQPPSLGPLTPAQDESSPVLPLAIDAPFNVYLPTIRMPTCMLNGQEETLAAMIVNHSEQGRPIMNCHPTLAEVARQRALDMGRRNYCSHVNPDGNGPNILVRQAGYRLPASWPTTPATLNYIESIACGFPTAQDAFNAWMASSGHRTHVLGRESFWAEQTNYGTGYAEVGSGEYRFYWVFISAPPQS